MNGPPPQPLLEAAEYFLSQRHFHSCRTYALRVQETAPHHHRAAQILAVASTLAAAEIRISDAHLDWYLILQIYRYSQDTHLINTQFKKLSLLLYPDQNKFPFADEAFKLVCAAGSVLTNPSKKTQFDNELQSFELRMNDTFWTVCPYCYYLYEYERVYEDCCLRCQNGKCGRGFHAMAVKSPPEEAVEKGKYMGMGFFPVGFDGGEGKGGFSWSPFSGFVRGDKNVEKENGVDGVSSDCNRESFIEISDESDESKCGVVRKNGGNCVNEQQRVDCVGKVGMKRRKKSVSRSAKKLMGRGSRIERMENVGQIGERLDLNTEAGGDDADCGNGNGNGNDKGNGLGGVGGVEMGSGADFGPSGVDLFAGDDDIFVGFPDCF